MSMRSLGRASTSTSILPPPLFRVGPMASSMIIARATLWVSHRAISKKPICSIWEHPTLLRVTAIYSMSNGHRASLRPVGKAMHQTARVCTLALILSTPFVANPAVSRSNSVSMRYVTISFQSLSSAFICKITVSQR